MPLTVLIVDDTVAYRQILSEIIGELDGVSVSDTAANGSIALKKLSLKPVDLVLLDVEMPVMDGLETLSQIKSQYPLTSVVMVSGCSAEATKTTMQALKLGALEFIRKPDGKNRDENKQQILSELRSVISIVRTRNILNADKTAAFRPPPRPPLTDNHGTGSIPLKHRPDSFGIAVIGVSTGGPNALTRLVAGLDAGFPLPILTVQHMPPNFTAALAEDLGKKTSLRVLEAHEGLQIVPGTMIIAQGGKHMVIRIKDNRPVVGLTDEPPENSCKPAVDVLFRSAANVYGERGVLSLVMTGMGSDGLAGVRTLKRKSTYCITQSAPTCVVYGMPRAIDEAGLSDESLDLDKISERMNQLAKRQGSLHMLTQSTIG